MRKIDITQLPVTIDNRINWKDYFLDHAQIGDHFTVAKTMRSGIQRQAAECGFIAQSVSVDANTISVTVRSLDTLSRTILGELATLSERQLIQIHRGCVQAKILPAL